MTHAAAAELCFVKGDAVLGDARPFCGQVLKKFRTPTRVQTWDITQKAYAISAYCDGVARTAVEEAIAADVFDCGVGGTGAAATTPTRRRSTIYRLWVLWVVGHSRWEACLSLSPTSRGGPAG